MKYVCPLFTVEDIERSREFYTNVLHQKVKEDYEQNLVFEGGFSLHLREHYAALLDNKMVRQGENNVEIYFEHDDLETLQEELKTAGVVFVHEITTQPWQQRVMRVYDPDNYIIEIGESLETVCVRLSREGCSVEVIMKLTSLPDEYVRGALQKWKN